MHHACTAQNGSTLCQKAIKDKLSTFFETTLLIVTQFHCLRACGQHGWRGDRPGAAQQTLRPKAIYLNGAFCY